MATFRWINAAGGAFETGANWDLGQSPGPLDDAVVGTAGNYTVTLSTSVAFGSLTLSDSQAALRVSNAGGTDAIAGAVSQSGTLTLDFFGGQGGSSLAIGGLLTNTGYLQIGNGNLTASTTLTVGDLANTGTISLLSSTTALASLIDNAAAAPVLAGQLNLSGNALVQFASGGIASVASGAQLTLSGAGARVAVVGQAASNSALTGLSGNAGTIRIGSGASVAIGTALATSGTLSLDFFGGEGGSSLGVAGLLNNTGYLQIGNGNLTAASTLTVGDLANTGTIALMGSTGTTAQAGLIDTAAAPAVLAGQFGLSGNALLQYASGGITSITSTGQLTLDGPRAVVAVAGQTGSSTALAGLSSNAGQIKVDNGATLAIGGALSNSGSFILDYFGGQGGSSVGIAGLLTNIGYLQVGNGGGGAASTLTVGDLANTGQISISGSGFQASLIDNAAAAATLTGQLGLSGNALLQYASGGITSVASTGQLTLDGPRAVVAVAGQTGSSTALAGLSSNAGQIKVDNGATLAIGGALSNSGSFILDYFGGQGGSSVGIAGLLTNTGYLQVGNGGGGAASTLTVGDLANTGQISISGSGFQASLIDNAAAAATLTGQLGLSGNALLQYASGGITSVASTGQLTLDGPRAVVAVAGQTGSSTALAGLSSNAGQIKVDNGATLAIGGALSNSGSFILDYFGGQGGSSLGIAGLLTNTGYLQVGNGGGGAASTLTVGDLANTGQISINGSGFQASLIDNAAAAATLAGQLGLSGNALLQYASGGITSVASTGQLTLDGPRAVVAVAGQTGSSTALAGLSSNAGQIKIDSGATLAIGGALSNSGSFILDYFGGQGGSSVSIAGLLTNTGYLQIGNGNLSAASTLTTAGLSNSGAFQLIGTAAATGTFRSTLAATNTATLTIGAFTILDASGAAYTQSGGTTEVDGALKGASIIVSGGVLDGVGTLTGSLRNDGGGTVFGGTGTTVPGTLSIAGSYEESGTGVLRVDILGTGAGQTSQIAVTGGPVTLSGGTLQVSTAPGFAFALGQVFTVMTFAPGALTGRFGAIVAGSATGTGAGVSLGNGLTLQAVYDNAGGAIRLQVTNVVLGGVATGTVGPATVNFGAVHTGDTPQQALTIANTATAPADNLDATVAQVSGAATASGQALLIAPGGSNATGVKVGLDTSTGGVKSGTVTIGLVSDPGGGGTQPLPSQSVAVQGTVYALAAAAITAPSLIVHQGDAGTVTFRLANTAPAGAYAENLSIRLTGTSGGVASTGASSLTLAPGAVDSSSVTFGYSATIAGTVAGTATFALVSDGGTGAGSIDGLGQTGLAPQTVSIGVTVDNYAVAAFQELRGGGTFTQSGTTATIDLGTIALGSGPLAIGLGVRNAATGPADLLSGALSAAGSAAFTAAGLAAFGGLQAGQSDTAPVFTLDTSTPGIFTETVTLTPTGSNASGYSAALPTQTLTITGRVAPETPPVITGPVSLSVTQAIPTVLGGITLTASDNGVVTLVVSDAAGIIAAAANSRITLLGNGTTSLTLTGLLTDIQAELASLTYTAAAPGTETVTVAFTDDHRLTATTSTAITAAAPPKAIPVFNSPVSNIVIPGVASGIGGLSVADPYSQSTGGLVTVVFSSNTGTLSVTGDYGGTILGQGTNTIAITGTIDQINNYLGDGLLESLGTALIENAFAYTVDKTIGFIKTGTIELLPNEEEIIKLGGGPEGKFFELGVVAASFALNAIIGALPGGTPPTLAALNQAITEIIGDPHILTPSGNLYDFNAVGEFVLATSTQPGDSFDVQVRLAAFNGSPYATAIAQVAAGIGTDRVTFATGRTATLWVNGTATTVTAANPLLLAGGEVEFVSANAWRVTWNTGEVLNVTNSGSFLGVSLSPGPNNPSGSLIGLSSLADSATDQFQLPDGTVLRQPLSTQTLYGVFADAWRVPQTDSLLDYGAGQTTADFTDKTRPLAQITLADLPASIVAAGNAAAAAAGITDAGAMAAIAFDYIISGGDPSIVAADAAFLTGLGTNPTPATRSGPAPVALGVIADQARVRATGTTDTTVTFDVYLTAAATTDTVVAYTVSTGSGTLDATAFGGTLPAGTVTIAAGQTTGQFTIVVPVAGLANLPSSTLQVQVSSPAGTAILAGTAQAKITQPVAGPPPIPVLSDLTRLGTFVRDGNNYTLDLGEIQYGEPVPDIHFALTNAGPGNADTLTGTFSVAPVEGFTVTGAILPQGLDGGQSYAGLTATVNAVKFGLNDETITFTPFDTNGTGFDAALAPITIKIVDTIVPPKMVFSYAYADVHIITYNGLRYDFQAVGEFTLAKSRVAGDSFNIQLRLEPYRGSSTVSIITQAAVSLGTDRVTFDLTRANYVAINGVAIDPSVAVTTLAAGTVTAISPTVYRVDWNSGETATFTNAGPWINVADGIPLSQPNQVGGLQGEDAGQSNDFQLSDGTVLAQPLTTAVEYGSFADSWRVTQPSSLFDYGPGQTTQTFTDRGFPRNPLTLASLPVDQVQAALALAATAGITDPGIAQTAAFDFIATNDAAAISSAAQVNAQIAHTTDAGIIASAAPLPAAGVVATPRSLVESGEGPTNATFSAYLTAPAAADTVITYSVIGSSAGDLGAAAFGGAFPTGSVTILAGQSSASFTIPVPSTALGTLPTAQVEVQIATAGPILVGTAATTIANNRPVAGTRAVLQIAKLSTLGVLTQTEGGFVLDLGTLVQNQDVANIQFALSNTALAPADSLGGAFTAPMGDGFTVFGNRITTPIQAGQRYDALYAGVQTDRLGAHTETFTFTPTDTNASGYSQALAPITFTIKDTIAASALGVLNTPTMIQFANVRVGTAESQAIGVGNTAVAPASSLNVTAAATGQATATGAVTALAPGATDSVSLRVGLDTTLSGARSGTVVLSNASIGVGGVPALLPTAPIIDVFGAAYNPAAASVAPISRIIHVGDAGAMALTIRNAIAADAYGETLVAAVAGATGGLVATGQARVAAGQSDAAAVIVTVGTASPSVYAGTVSLGLMTDGGTGADSIDGLGTLALPSQAVPVSVTVDAYAQAAFEALGGGVLTLTAPGQYTLDLGSAVQGAAALTAALGVLNAATGPADLLAGSFSVAGAAGFANTGFAAFSGLGAQQDVRTLGVSLGTAAAGTFSETIALAGTGSNASGYAAAVAPATLTVTGTVTLTVVIPPPPPPPPPAVGINPFATLAATDSDPAAIVTVTVATQPAIPGTYGTLGAGSIGADGRTYTVSGTAAQVTAALAAVTLEPTGPAPAITGLIASITDGGALSTARLTATGGLANDLTVNSAADAVAAGAGPDTLRAGVAGALLLGGAGPDILVGNAGGSTQIGGTGNTTYFSQGGPTQIYGGTGRDTIQAALGNVTVVSGTGGSLIGLGSGTALVNGQGADTILGGSGAAIIGAAAGSLVGLDGGPATVSAAGGSTVVGGSGSAVVGVRGGGILLFEGAGPLVFNGGSGSSTVVGGAGGHAVIVGGAGGGVFTGGTGGGNIIVGGLQSSTLTGGGAGDVLFSRGAGGTILQAGSGNETLQGGASSGADTFFAGSGDNLIGLGSGNDAVFGGAGNATVVGGSGRDIYAFAQGRAGGHMSIIGFKTGTDLISLQGYAPGEIGRAIASAASDAGGPGRPASTTLTLSDRTQITLLDVSSLNTRIFG